MSSMII